VTFAPCRKVALMSRSSLFFSVPSVLAGAELSDAEIVPGPGSAQGVANLLFFSILSLQGMTLLHTRNTGTTPANAVHLRHVPWF
jgi:hypothetical protein